MRLIHWGVGVFVMAVLGAAAHAAEGRQEQSLDTDWRFVMEDGGVKSDAAAPAFDDSSWKSATLPHTPHLEPANVQFPWQGIAWYRRHLAFDPAWRGKRVSIEFGAAMQVADVYLNGKLKTHHIGGYLPFTIDVTGDLLPAGDNVIAVRIDNRDTQEFPPGKPIKSLDFVYPAGIYRGVRLVVTNPVHITDPLAANVVAGGGVFVRYDHVSAESATVSIRTDVANDGSAAQPYQVASTLVAPDGSVAAEETSDTFSGLPGKSHTTEQTLTVRQPKLWDPDHPNRYTLQSKILVDHLVVDELSAKIGIRHLDLSPHALRINGTPIVIRGTNRHQEYPILEYAISPEASRRDARLIKDGGFNFVRLSHYPQDPAFLDACDELGVLVQEPIPGWQQFWKTDSFINASYQFERDMIRRDRNHPSIVFWETNLNETRSPTDFRVESQKIAHTEYPGDQCFTFGDPYAGAPWDVKGLIREYGDWAFGGNASTSRQTRGDGEKAMLQQTWNFLWTWNLLLKPSDDPRHAFIGGGTWVMFDYNRGYNEKPCTCGMMDIFRLPKYVYYFYQSQRDPRVVRADVASGPMVFIADHWARRPSPAKVVVFSNCEEIELRLNGRVLKRQKPDAGPDTPYSAGKNASLETVGNRSDKSGGNPFDGGNCTHLDHAPFTFNDVPWESGKLTAIGYLDGKPVATCEVKTPGKPAAIHIDFDTAGVPFQTNDVIFARARIEDADGTPVPTAKAPVTFSVTGPAQVVGSDTVAAEAGIASILVHSTTAPGEIAVTAQAEGLPAVTVKITSVVEVHELK